MCVQANDAQVMCHWVLELLQTYSSYNKGRVNLQTAPSLRQSALGESYRYCLCLFTVALYTICCCCCCCC